MKIKHGSILVAKLVFGLVLCLGSVSQDFTESIKSRPQLSDNRLQLSGLSFGFNAAHSSSHYVERISVTGYQLAYSTAFQPTLDYLYNIGFFDAVLAGVISTNSNGETTIEYEGNASDSHMDAEDIADGAALAKELKDRLNQLINEANLTSEMKQRIASDIGKLNRFINKSNVYLNLLNSSTQAIAHAARAEYLAAAAEVTGLLAGILTAAAVTGIAGVVGSPVWLAGAIGAVLAFHAASSAEAFAETIFEGLSRHHNVNPYVPFTSPWYTFRSEICTGLFPANWCGRMY